MTIKTSDEKPPNLLIKGRTTFLNADEINNFNQNNMPVYFFGFLEYKDEKGKRFRQAFGLQIKHNNEWVFFGACDYNYRIEIDKNKKICE